MLELFIKYFKTTIIRNFQQAITNSLQTDGKKKLSKEISVKKCQTEIIKLKSTTKTKLLNEVNRRVQMTEDRSNEFEDRSIGFT